MFSKVLARTATSRAVVIVCNRKPLLRALSTLSSEASSSSGRVIKHDSGDSGRKFLVSAKDVMGKGKLRLDAYLTARWQEASRAKIQASIKEGLVLVNGHVQSKASAALKAGDEIVCSLLPPAPMEAIPEDIALDVMHEDEHLIVINKPAGMVVHISAGHHTGTLVNALLHHCGLPAVRLMSSEDPGVQTLVEAGQPHAPGSTVGPQPPSLELLRHAPVSLAAAKQGARAASRSTSSTSSTPQAFVADDLDDGDSTDEGEDDLAPLQYIFADGSSSSSCASSGIIRPGIVHRLDKGTTGVMVVAKTEAAQRHLCAQFKDRTVGRAYMSIVLGMPFPPKGRVEANIARDPGDRKRMAAFAYASSWGRVAASNYEVLERLADGAAALVQWKLDTGRTHQIRVHAKHIGHPLFGDDTYGGGAAASANMIARNKPNRQLEVKALVAQLARPALHAQTLAFDHPVTNDRLAFGSQLPADFDTVLNALRALGSGS